MNSQKSIEEIISDISSSTSSGIRIGLIRKLGELSTPDPRVEIILRDLSSQDNDPDVKKEADIALQRLNYEEEMQAQASDRPIHNTQKKSDRFSMKKCPFCAEEIQVEAILCRYCGSELEVELAPDDRKKCPYCAEWIKADAVVCRYCRSDIPQAASPKPFKARKSLQPVKVPKDEIYPLPDHVKALLRELKSKTTNKRVAIHRARTLDKPYPEVLNALKSLENTASSEYQRECAKEALLALEGKQASLKPPRTSPLPSPKTNILQDNYLKSGSWYARGRFGGVALIVAIGAGLYAYDSGDIAVMALAVTAGLIALALLGGRGIVSKIVTWAVLIGLLALCGTFFN